MYFTPEQEVQLAQIATKAGTGPEHLVKDAALRLLAEEARFRAAVREGIAQADRSEFIEEEEWTLALSRCCAPEHASPPDASRSSRAAQVCDRFD